MTPSEVTDFTTVGGIIVLTSGLVQLSKAWFKATPYLRAVPIIVWAIVIAIALCLLARAAGYMSGSVGRLIAQTVLAALSSSGLYSVVTRSATQSLGQGDDTGPSNPNPLPPVDTVKPPTDNTYTNAVKLVLLFLSMLAVLVAAGGCQQTPKQVYYNTKLAYVETLETLADLRDQGLVSERVNDQLRPARASASLALGLWKQALDAGDTATADAQQRAFQTAYTVILTIKATLTAALPPTPRPTTRPTTQPVFYLKGTTREPCRFACRAGRGGESRPARFRAHYTAA